MKIWKAELFLIYDLNDEWITRFNFELQDENYKINEYNDKEWVFFKNWVSYRIPKYMKVQPSTSGFKVEQGFDYELTEEELEQLKKDMIEEMKKCLTLKKERYLQTYETQIQVLEGGINECLGS